MALDWSWITTNATTIIMTGVSALGIYAALVLFTRLSGLRSFSKMSSYDFAITVAFGSVLAGTILAKEPPLLQAIGALAFLYVIQYIVSKLRIQSESIAQLVDNGPVLVMAGTEMLHDNMKRVRMTPDDLKSKLREANVIHYEQVRAVIMEATGDVTVLHANPDEPDLDLDLLEGVDGVEQLEEMQHTKQEKERGR